MKLPKGKVWDMKARGYFDPSITFWTYGTKVRSDQKILFLGGSVSLDAKGRLVGKDDMRAQIKQCMENIKSILATEGATLKDVVNRRIYTTNIEEYYKACKGWANEEYPDFWDQDPASQRAPSGTLLQV
ncbi:MAG: RidA family protein, partial [Nitrososphaerales archaeon]